MSARARLYRLAAVVFFTAGTLVVADAVTTLVWEEPVTALRAARAQSTLARDLERLAPAPRSTRAGTAAVAVNRAPTATATATASAARPRGPSRRRLATLATRLDKRVARGGAIGRLRIPALHLSTVMVHGSALDDLRRGAGTVDGAPLPGGRGTAAVAGHRTTYGAPFRDIDALRRGDLVVAEMPYATLRYRVEGRRIVWPTDVAVLRRTGHDRLVLIACHPRFSAAQRIVVFARLVDAGARS